MNNKNALFTQSAGLKRSRRLFPQPYNVKTSFDAGLLVPLDVQEVLPGGEWQVDMSTVLRGLTPMYPVMDNAYLDVYAFSVPNRTVWQHWEAFRVGAATETPGTPADYTSAPTYSVPQINMIAPTTGTLDEILLGSFWDYAGVGWFGKQEIQPSAKLFEGDSSLSALYPRGYVKIWNEWFRDENYQQPAVNYIDDSNRNLSGAVNPTGENSFRPGVPGYLSYSRTVAHTGRVLLPVNKYHDYFTSGLPQTQKQSSPILIPLTGTGFANNAYPPNIVAGDRTKIFTPYFYEADGSPRLMGSSIGTNDGTNNAYFGASSGSKTNQAYMSLSVDFEANLPVTLQRLAFQTQRFKEQLARTGSRYQEYLQGCFGVYASDARLDRAEFLGGRRTPINQHQVAQTAENAEEIGLGATGAFTFTPIRGKQILHYTAKEDCILYILCCVRTNHTYCQGVPRQFLRRDMYDYYNPVFAHISEQPIEIQEITNISSAYPTSALKNNSVFAYKEAWAEYRYKPDRCCGYMKPSVKNSLGQWSYADNYETSFVKTGDWLCETVSNIDRTLAVSSENTHQFFGDFYFNCKVYNIMPIHSVPSLVDHDFY